MEFNAAIAILVTPDGKYSAAVAYAPKDVRGAKPSTYHFSGAYDNAETTPAAIIGKAAGILSGAHAKSARVVYTGESYRLDKLSAHGVELTVTRHKGEDKLPQGMRYLYAKAMESAKAGIPADQNAKNTRRVAEISLASVDENGNPIPGTSRDAVLMYNTAVITDDEVAALVDDPWHDLEHDDRVIIVRPAQYAAFHDGVKPD